MSKQTNEMVTIIDTKGKISTISKRSWEANKLSMPEWRIFDIHEEPIEIKSDKVTKKLNNERRKQN